MIPLSIHIRPVPTHLRLRRLSSVYRYEILSPLWHKRLCSLLAVPTPAIQPPGHLFLPKGWENQQVSNYSGLHVLS